MAIVDPGIMLGFGVIIVILFFICCIGLRVERWIGFFVATDDTWMGEGDAVGRAVDLQHGKLI